MFRFLIIPLVFFSSSLFAIAGGDGESIDDRRAELIKSYAAGGWSYVDYNTLNVSKFHTIIHRARTTRFDPTRRVTLAFCIFDLETSIKKRRIQVFFEGDESGGKPIISANGCEHHSRILDSSVRVKLMDEGKQIIFFKNLGLLDAK